LPSHEQKLLSTIACFRSPVELKTLEAIAKDVGATHESPLQDDLHDLVSRGLLHFDDKNKKFDLHPIVRRYAYERLTASDRTAAHNRLIDYFEAVPKLEKIDKLEDLAPVIELYHHMLKAGEFEQAVNIAYERLHDPLYFQFGAYGTILELISALIPDSEDKLTSFKQSWVLGVLANSFCQSGQPRSAEPLLEKSQTISESSKDEKNIAVSLRNNAKAVQFAIGSLSKASSYLKRSIEMCKTLQDERGEAISHRELGNIMSYCGMWNDAENEFAVAQSLFKKIDFIHGTGVTWAHHAICVLLMKRFGMLVDSPIELAGKSLRYAKEWSKSYYPVEKELIRGNWILGCSYRFQGQYELSEIHMVEALVRDRAINMVELEANILLDLARLRYDQKKSEEAKSPGCDKIHIRRLQLGIAQELRASPPSRSNPATARRGQRPSGASTAACPRPRTRSTPARTGIQAKTPPTRNNRP
jgi:tetratricopeptide (TPR) repeat protein